MFTSHSQEPYLVGGFSPTPLKNDGRILSWDDLLFPTEWTVIKFHGSKAPTSYTWNDWPLLSPHVHRYGFTPALLHQTSEIKHYSTEFHLPIFSLFSIWLHSPSPNFSNILPPQNGWEASWPWRARTSLGRPWQHRVAEASARWSLLDLMLDIIESRKDNRSFLFFFHRWGIWVPHWKWGISTLSI